MKRNIIVIGSPYWARHLAGVIKEAGGRANFVPNRRIFRIYGNLSVVLLAVGLGGRPGFKGWSMWLAFFTWWIVHRRPHSIVLYWIGTDVAVTAARKPNQILAKLWQFMGVKHICGAPWFEADLASAGIAATPVLFPYDTKDAELRRDTRPTSRRFTVLTYLRSEAWKSSRGADILRLAKQSPELVWRIIGMRRDEVPGKEIISDNVEFLGWVDQPLQALENCHAFIRMVDHDAYSGMVRDAQAMGRPVLYNKSVDGVIDISNHSDEDILSEIYALRLSVQNECSYHTRHTLPSYSAQKTYLLRSLEIE